VDDKTFRQTAAKIMRLMDRLNAEERSRIVRSLDALETLNRPSTGTSPEPIQGR
jgi:hypothetical protein